MNLLPPDAAEAQILADGVAAAVAGREGLLPMQRSLIEAFFPAMTGHPVTVSPSVKTTPRGLATALARRTLEFRERAVQVMLLCALVRHPIPDDVAQNVAEFARDSESKRAWSTSPATSPPGPSTWLCWTSSGTATRERGTSRRRLQPCTPVRCYTMRGRSLSLIPSSPRQWAALEHLPAEAIGRKVWELYQARGFIFPGLPGSAPPLLAQHDWVHVLGDYGTTVESEVEVFGFIARANDDMHAFSLLAMVISLFETGYLATGAGLFEASPGHFSSSPSMAVRLSDAMRRGALCRDQSTGADSIDFLKLDWLSLAHVPCEELRTRFNLVSKSPEAVAAKSVGPWEAGGISPFQIKAGKDMAARAGVAYDAAPACRRRPDLRTRGTGARRARGGDRSAKREDRAWKRCWRHASPRHPR